MRTKTSLVECVLIGFILLGGFWLGWNTVCIFASLNHSQTSSQDR